MVVLPPVLLALFMLLIYFTKVIIYSLLVVLPPVLLALLMSGNTWELNSSRLSPTTTNFLCHYPTLSDPIFCFYIKNLIVSIISLFQVNAQSKLPPITNQAWCSLPSYRGLWPVAATAMWLVHDLWSVTINSQVGNTSCTTK